MYDINEIKYLYDRLKAQYPRYAADFSGECLTLTLLHGRVEVNRKGCLLFVNEKLYDELSSEEVDDADDLYELIEMFLIQMQRLGMESGNETYIAARDKAIQKGDAYPDVCKHSVIRLFNSFASDKKSYLFGSVFSVSCSRILASSSDTSEGFSSILGMSGMRSDFAY